MRAGDFACALRLHDLALRRRLLNGERPDDPALPYHRRWVWDGTAPDGRDVLVRCRHGLGDTLMCLRFLPPLRARARSVTLEAPAPLAAWLASAALADRVVPMREDAPLPRGPCDVEIMELAHALRMLPPPPPLLPAPPPRAAAAAAPRVGFCWRGGGWDPHRDLPFALLAPLPALPGLRAVGLQRGEPELPAPPEAVADAAALVAGLDLVVSVDTMVAHLAAGLGVPCLVLLRARADWRWMRGPRTRWYPRAHLLRQRREGEWAPVVAHARHLLARWLARRRAERGVAVAARASGSGAPGSVPTSPTGWGAVAPGRTAPGTSTRCSRGS